ncbi:hypothetical protein [Parerythrobacter aestuarii]|uniref:hypothetical protein n=1 Tax=Parerythrobacter aestuarii TaxID=3020909 RepID=UPI0024DE4F7E|nr:hypothetical protein [Parerythrobacter aestuarii]
MTEQSKIEAATPADTTGAGRTPVPWSQDFATSEHPDTARHRIQREYIMAVTELPRGNLERKYAYLQQLISRAKEELGHARSANNEHRMAAMQQNIDELVAYVSGYGIRANLPNRNGENGSTAIASFYVLEEIPTFLGELGFLIDRWYEEELAGIHDELLKLTGLAGRLR